MDELVEEFLSETSEGLEALDNQIVELEKDQDNEALLSSIFRIMHTIKGTCGFLGLNKLASVAHAGENIMDKLRNKQLSVNPDIISVILEAVDNIKFIVAYIGEHGVEPENDYAGLIKKFNAVADGKFDVISIETKTEKVSEIKPEEKPIKKEEVEQKEAQEVKEVVKSSEKPIALPEKATTTKTDHNTTQTIKVNVDVLESLMQIVSELVLNRNQLIQLDRTLRDNRFASSIQRLNVITSELQETVMETRMQPIGSAWVKVPRMIRDLSKELNKKIKLVMLGEETELDRQLIESIKDPLVHMIRNSADHGIESPEERIAKGKPEEGTITLQAFHQGGHIIIEISDDGRGLNLTKIKSKALQNKLVTEKELSSMSDAQIMQFIFRAGFSTAETITAVSGRGVGMDVVKKNIDDIRGTVELKSIEGKGSTFMIKIPLTLAIMPILVVEVGALKFGIPQVNVIEMVKTGGSSEYIMEEINGIHILRLRDILLPLLSLSEILQISKQDIGKDIYVVVCEVNGINFGIIVDRIYDTEEIVLKPVSKLIKSISVYSGNTLLGNGDVIMILDPAGIVKYLTDTHKDTTSSLTLSDQKHLDSSRASRFLILKSGQSLKAIPLELVSRLEEIDVTKIEVASGRFIVQYRGTLMFLENLDPDYQIPKKGSQQVVVFASYGHVLGLIVEEIVDIIEQDVEVTSAFEDEDITAVVLGGKTMDLVDINTFFNKAFPSEEQFLSLPKGKSFNLLLVDDSFFFRKTVSNFLTKKGFKVHCKKTAYEALPVLKENPNKFDAIITDINMPTMDGFEFAKICAADDKIKNIPIIALTSDIKALNDSDKIEENGIKKCISKTNQNELISAIFSLINIGDSA